MGLQLTRDVLHAVTGRPVPAFRRVSLTILAAGFAAALMLAIGPSHAHSSPLDPCEPPVTNVVACENSLPGSPRSEWDITGSGDDSIQGYATALQRRPRTDGPLQGEDGRIRLSHRHLSPRVLRRARSAEDRDGHSERGAAPAAAGMCLGGSDGSGRLRQLGGVGVLDVPADGGVGRVHRQARARPTRAARATSPSSSATTSATPTSSSRPRTRRGRRTTATAATASTSALPPGRAYKVSYNRPFTTRSAQRPRRSSSAASTRWCAGSSATATTSATSPASTLTAARRRDPRAQDIPLGRARRVLVGRAARQRGGGARRRRQPRVLQRQRGVLEDPLGAEHRRRRNAVPHARLLQGDAANAKIDPEPRVDRHVARRALQPARGRRPPGERAHRHVVHGQLPTARMRSRSRRHTAQLRLWRNTRIATLATGRDGDAVRRARSGTSGTRTWTTASGPPG